MTEVSFKASSKEMVCLLSSVHSDALINTSGKPKIIMVYNVTKSAVDKVYQMYQNMNCNRKIQCWPLRLFCNMMNISRVNTYVVYVFNFLRNNGFNSKPSTRQ